MRAVHKITSKFSHLFWVYSPLLMVLTAFALRLTIILVQHPYQFPTDLNSFSFGGETGSIARSVAQGEGFSSPFTGSTGPTAWIGPIYVYLCAAVFKVFGIFSPASAIVILSLNSLFSALTCAVIYRLGVRIGDRPLGIAAGWFWAIVPQFMTLCTTWVWETSLSALLIPLAILFALELAEHLTLRMSIAFGVFWGLCILTNPALLSVFPLSLAWIALRLRIEPAHIKNLAVAVLLCVVTISPWMIRNRIVFGQWVFIRSNFAFEFYLDNHAMKDQGSFFSEHPTSNPAEYARYKQIGEIAFINLYRDKAIAFVKQNPTLFLERTGRRIVEIWTSGVLIYICQLSKPPLDLQARFILPLLMFPGIIVAAAKRIRYWGLITTVMFLYPLPYYITFPSPRYRHPIEPLMLLMATYFCVETVRVLRRIAGTQRNTRSRGGLATTD